MNPKITLVTRKKIAFLFLCARIADSRNFLANGRQWMQGVAFVLAFDLQWYSTHGMETKTLDPCPWVNEIVGEILTQLVTSFTVTMITKRLFLETKMVRRKPRMAQCFS